MCVYKQDLHNGQKHPSPGFRKEAFTHFKDQVVICSSSDQRQLAADFRHFSGQQDPILKKSQIIKKKVHVLFHLQEEEVGGGLWGGGGGWGFPRSPNAVSVSADAFFPFSSKSKQMIQQRRED